MIRGVKIANKAETKETLKIIEYGIVNGSNSTSSSFKVSKRSNSHFSTSRSQWVCEGNSTSCFTTTLFTGDLV